MHVFAFSVDSKLSNISEQKFGPGGGVSFADACGRTHFRRGPKLHINCFVFKFGWVWPEAKVVWGVANTPTQNLSCLNPLWRRMAFEVLR